MAVSVALTDVKAGVQAISSKVGLKQDGDMMKAAILEDDTTLTKYFDEAMSMLTGILGKFCSAVNNTSNTYSFTISEPSTWGSTEARISSLALTYAINYVCACWFQAVKPELEERYKALYAVQESSIVRELIIRNKPTR